MLFSLSKAPLADSLVALRAFSAPQPGAKPQTPNHAALPCLAAYFPLAPSALFEFFFCVLSVLCAGRCVLGVMGLLLIRISSRKHSPSRLRLGCAHT